MNAADLSFDDAADDSAFIMESSPLGPDMVCLRSCNFPEYLVYRFGSQCLLREHDDTADFESRATFRVRYQSECEGPDALDITNRQCNAGMLYDCIKFQLLTAAGFLGGCGCLTRHDRIRICRSCWRVYPHGWRCLVWSGEAIVLDRRLVG